MEEQIANVCSSFLYRRVGSGGSGMLGCDGLGLSTSSPIDVIGSGLPDGMELFLPLDSIVELLERFVEQTHQSPKSETNLEAPLPESWPSEVLLAAMVRPQDVLSAYHLCLGRNKGFSRKLYVLQRWASSLGATSPGLIGSAAGSPAEILALHDALLAVEAAHDLQIRDPEGLRALGEVARSVEGHVELGIVVRRHRKKMFPSMDQNANSFEGVGGEFGGDFFFGGRGDGGSPDREQQWEGIGGKRTHFRF